MKGLLQVRTLDCGDLILGPRQSGRTDALIRHASREWLYIVTSSRREVVRIADRARYLGLDIPFPMTYCECARPYGRGVRGLLLDNTEHFLRETFQGVLGRAPIAAMTLTT